jgi:hypothetical protein
MSTRRETQVNAQEATERQILALENAETHAHNLLSPSPKTWIKIAAGWDSLTYRLEDAEQTAVRMAELRQKVAEFEKGEASG